MTIHYYLYTTSLAGSIVSIVIRDGVNGAARLVMPEFFFSNAAGWNLYKLELKTPIQFTKGNLIQIDYGTARTNGDFEVINMYGWEE